MLGAVEQRARMFGLTALAAGAVVAAAQTTVFHPRSQCFGAFPYRAVDPDRDVDRPPRIALTFDDGPNEPYTSALLDLLGEREVRATFFQVGRCAERHPATTRRVVTQGHVLANHSYSHAWSRYLSQPRQVREVTQGRAALRAIAGVDPLLYRPPWLCHPPWVLRTVAASGAQVVSGTFGHPWEVLQPPAAWLAAGAVRRARRGAVLILHDGREGRGGPRGQTVAAVGEIVDRLRDQGYAFATVDELLDCPAYG